jgi:peptidoglycan/LPS O-acetylase OafA/YrhL
VYGDPRTRPLPTQAGLAVVYVAVVLAMSWLTYRAVERPTQALGRRLARSLSREPAKSPQRTEISTGNLG